MSSHYISALPLKQSGQKYKSMTVIGFNFIYTSYVVYTWGDTYMCKTSKIRGMAGKFVDTSAIRKSNALLKKRFA